ncbi:MAG: hypothetical protein WC308_04380 [archaeon]|jgi:hypothetical protein
MAEKKEPIKIAFFDIDGVLTPTDEFIPGTSPVITEDSIRVLKEFKRKGFTLVFITARSARELRMKSGFESKISKNGLLKDSLIYASTGLDYITYAHEFKIKNGKPVFRNGDAIIILRPVVKRETFGSIDQFLLYKMLLGKEIKQQYKYAGFRVAPAVASDIVGDARIFFEFVPNTPKERRRAVAEGKRIVEEQRKIFGRTKKYGTPVDLKVRDIVAGVSIEPRELGKHFGVLRALKACGVMPCDRLIAYAFGDSKSDRLMKIRKDITFFRVKHEQFIETAEKLLRKV